MMDSSTGVRSLTHQQQKDFIKAMARQLNIAPKQSRAALLLYSTSSSVIGDLDSFPNLQSFETAVNGAPHLGGLRRIDQALEAAARILSSGRDSVPKLAILLTTGRQAEVPGITPLDVASQSLRDVNARAYVIAIGKDPDVRELRLIVEEPSDVVSVSSGDYLIPKVSDVSRDIRELASIGM